MLERYRRVRYELLRPEEVAERRAAAPIAYVPLGALEWHGLQNPLGTDGLKAHAICCEAASLAGGVVLPPFYLGLLRDANWGPAGWEGYTLGFNQPAMLEAALTGVVRALTAAGWQVVVGVTGHDVQGQVDAFEAALAAGGGHGFGCYEGQFQKPDDELPYGMDHAGAWETSCMMHLCPDSVDLDALRRRGLAEAEDLDMAGAEGIGGKTPLRHASAEMGRRIVTRMGRLLAERAVALLPPGGTGERQ